MATVGAFNVALTASVARFIAPVRNAERTWASLARTVQRSSRTMEASQRRATLASISLARALTRGGAVMAATFSGLALWGVRLAAQFEQTQIAFETLLGSANEARDLLGHLERLARRTPFAFSQLQSMARQMLAWGFARHEVEAMLAPIGDFVAAMGGGQETMDRVIRALGQIRARGVLAAQEMLQLTEAGIPAWELLAERIGVSIPEAMKLVQRRAVSASLAIEAVIDGLQRRFAGAMARQSRTLLGRWEQIKDAVSIVLRGLGADVIRLVDLGDRLAWLAEALGRFADVVSERGLIGALQRVFPPWLQPVLVGIAGAIAGALVPAVLALAKALRALAVAQVANLLLLGRWMLIGAAVASMVWLLSRAVGGFGNLIRGTALVWGAVFLGAASLVVQAIGHILQAIAIVVPALRGAADAVVDWALQQRQVADQWLQAAASARRVADSVQDVAESGQQASRAQQQLAETMQGLTEAANDNIQSFDEVYQLQQEMAAAIPEIPVPEFPEIPAPPGAPDMGGVSPVAGLGSQIEEISSATASWMDILSQAAQTMEQAAGAARDAWDRLRSFVVSAWSDLERRASIVWANIRSAVSSGWDVAAAAVAAGAWSTASALTGGWAWIGQAATAIWSSVRAAATVGWDALPALVRDAAAAVADAVGAAWANIVHDAWTIWMLVRAAATDGWETARALVRQGAQMTVDAIETVWNGLVSFAAWLWAIVRDYMTRMWDGIDLAAALAWFAVEGALRTAWDSIRAAAASFWSAIRSGLAAAWSDLGAIASSAWEAVRAAAEAVWSAIVTAASTTWTAIRSTVEHAWSGLDAWASRVWGNVREAVASAWNALFSVAWLVWSALRDVVTGAWDDLADWASRVWSGVQQAAVGAWNALAGAAFTMWSAIRAAIMAGWSGLTQWTESIWNDIQTAAAGAWQALASAASQQWNAIRKAIQTGWETAQNIVSQAAVAIRSAIDQMVQQVMGLVRRLHDAVVTWFEDKKTRVSQAVESLVQGVTSAFQALYDRLVGHSIIPDLVARILGWFKELADSGTSIIDSLAQRMQFTLSTAFDRIIQGGLSFSDAMTMILQSVGDAARGVLADQISRAVSQSLAALGKWVLGAVRRAAAAIGAFIQQAYAALLAFFAWSGPFAPALAAGVIAAGMAGMAALARRAAGLVGLAEGGIVTGPTVALLGERRRREAVIPLERDNVLAESIGDAVLQAMLTAMRIGQAATQQPGSGEREIVLRIDGTSFARAVLPAIIREGQRQGLQLVVQAQGV